MENLPVIRGTRIIPLAVRLVVLVLPSQQELSPWRMARMGAALLESLRHVVGLLGLSLPVLVFLMAPV
jgi:hypothetical protein